MGDYSGPVNGTLPAIVNAAAFASQEYDYVICGGGTAGLTIAARLTENPNITVGVIEAGGNHLDDPIVDTPAMFLKMLMNEEYDWCFKTTPQRLNNEIKEHHVPRGKLLGGSSGINYMMYVRGSDADYDDWADIVGDESWSSKNFKHYMKKHQTLDPISEKVKDRSTMPFVGENHGTDGPIHTSFNSWKCDIEDDIVKAADQATGFTKKPMDPWSGDHIGFYHTLAAVGRTGNVKGKRSYAARGYLEPSASRPNLRVVTNSLVTKVLLEGDTAVGAAYRWQGQNFEVKAKREVIVCGGAINSPQILELSGIGNPDVLKAAGIETKIENRTVGENFQDHVVVGAAYETVPGVTTLDNLAKPENLQAALKILQEEQDGPLTAVSTVQGFFPFTLFATDEEVNTTIASIEGIQDQTEYSKKQRATVIAHLKNDKSANLQLVAIPLTPDLVIGHSDQSKLFKEHDPSKPQGFMLAVCLQYPVSRGSVHVKTSNPEDHPAIDPGYLRHDADIDVLAAGFKFADALARAPAMKGKIGKRIFPAQKWDLTKTESCRQAVLDWYMGEYHICGSNAMGDTLDNKLRLKGAKNLRVADASSFPGNVSGNIMGSVYALAEKTADIIKADWN